jgi:predicted ArsR family transcriptional regulator
MYVEGQDFLTAKQAAQMLNMTREGARYQLDLLTERGLIMKSSGYTTFYSRVKSSQMTEKIISELNKELYG